MSFDLRIHFIGLGMYVPEDTEVNGERKITAMHVLLPSADHAHVDGAGGEHHEVEKHFSRIVFDTAYTKSGQTEFNREYQFIDFERRELDLRGLPTQEGFNPALPGELAPMDRVAKPVDRKHVTNLPDETLAGRVSMNSGALTDYSLGALFRLNGGDVQRMTLETEWTIRGITSTKPQGGNSVPCLLARPLAIANGDATELPDLFPVGDTIHLMVFDAVSSVFPPQAKQFRIDEAKADKDTDHFVAYYNIAERLPDLTRAQFLPAPNGKADVLTKGDAKVPEIGQETPSLGCVQTTNRLA